MLVQAGELHSCGRSKYVVITQGPHEDGAYEGHCVGCHAQVFGTVYPEIPIQSEDSNAPLSDQL